MRHKFYTILCLAALRQPPSLRRLTKGKLRQSIEMPPISTSLSVHFLSSERDGQGNKYVPTQKLESLQKRLKETRTTRKSTWNKAPFTLSAWRTNTRKPKTSSSKRKPCCGHACRQPT